MSHFGHIRFLFAIFNVFAKLFPQQRLFLLHLVCRLDVFPYLCNQNVSKEEKKAGL